MTVVSASPQKHRLPLPLERRSLERPTLCARLMTCTRALCHSPPGALLAEARAAGADGPLSTRPGSWSAHRLPTLIGWPSGSPAAERSTSIAGHRPRPRRASSSTDCWGLLATSPAVKLMLGVAGAPSFGTVFGRAPPAMTRRPATRDRSGSLPPTPVCHARPPLCHLAVLLFILFYVTSTAHPASSTRTPSTCPPPLLTHADASPVGSGRGWCASCGTSDS